MGVYEGLPVNGFQSLLGRASRHTGRTIFYKRTPNPQVNFLLTSGRSCIPI